MNRTIYVAAAIFGILAIALGAFGAHGLKMVVDAQDIQVFETGVRYQMYHALFLLFLANTVYISEQKKRLIFYLITIGTVLFSFSIYFLATNDLTGFNFGTIGFITPIGGVLLLLGWAVFGYRILKYKKDKI